MRVPLCNLMLREAMAHGASDIHLQPMGSEGVLRVTLAGAAVPPLPQTWPLSRRAASSTGFT